MQTAFQAAPVRRISSHDEEEMKQSTLALHSQVPVNLSLARLQKRAGHAATLLKVMANPNRLIILCQLAEGEKAVGELERVVGLSQSALSQHLSVLRQQGVVTTRRSAQSIFYSLASKEVETIMVALHDVFCAKSR
jgi:DNA-binding transcriptional ArsR family regulator